MKKINVTQSSMPVFEEYIEEIKPIFESRWLTNMGEKHNELTKQLQNYLGAENVSLFCNGHLALETAIQALGLSGEVITTPFTFISTTHAIVRNNLAPVFCDINEDDYTIDVSKIEDLITEKTSAIVAVHVYGNLCDVGAIEKIAKKHGLKVIYDAAHSFGQTYNGTGAAAFGDVSIFSFHATKVFHSIEGGCACYSAADYGKKLDAIRNFGMYSQEDIGEVGTNGKMNEFSAAMGICNLRHIEDEINKRKRAVIYYRNRLKNIKGIKLCKEKENIKYNYAYFPVVFDKCKFGKDRDEVMKILADNGVFARKYFYPITPKAECYKDEFLQFSLPIADEISKNVLTLPLYADITEEEIEFICSLILR